MKIFWLFSHPAPYKVGLFNLMGQKSDLHVLFERNEEYDRNKDFYIQKPESFTVIPPHSLYLGKHNSWTRRSIKELKDPSYDILVINGWSTFSEQYAISYCRQTKKPYFFFINGGIVPKRETKAKKILKRTYISGAALFFCPDEKSKEYLIHYGAKPERIVVYPYSSLFNRQILDKPLNEKEKETRRKKLGIEGEKVYFSAGQFIERKNYELLFDIWARMPRDHHLYVIGEGRLKRDYLSLIESLHLSNVHLLPFMRQDELLKYLSCGDGFVLLSKEDIYGHVIHEALSQGIPVVASDKINAAHRLIENGKNGFIVPLDEADTIYESLTLLESSMGEDAIKTAKNFSMEIEADFLLDIFEQAIKAKGE